LVQVNQKKTKNPFKADSPLMLFVAIYVLAEKPYAVNPSLFGISTQVFHFKLELQSHAISPHFSVLKKIVLTKFIG